MLFIYFLDKIKFSHCIWWIWLFWIFILIYFCHFTFLNEIAIFEPVNENLPKSSCHFWKQKSVFLQILYQSSVPSNITTLYFFSSNIIYFDQKQPIKVQSFENFNCSGQNSTNSSCQFWNNKPIPLSILYHSSLSWHITPL